MASATFKPPPDQASPTSAYISTERSKQFCFKLDEAPQEASKVRGGGGTARKCLALRLLAVWSHAVSAHFVEVRCQGCIKIGVHGDGVDRRVDWHYPPGQNRVRIEDHSAGCREIAPANPQFVIRSTAGGFHVPLSASSFGQYRRMTR